MWRPGERFGEDCENNEFEDFYLVVELEQGVVYDKFIALEPFKKVADDGKSVDDRRSHGG